MVNAGSEGFWFAQLKNVQFVGLQPGPSPALGTVTSGNILFPAIFCCSLFELELTSRSPSVVRVSLRFCELMGRFTSGMAILLSHTRVSVFY